MKKLLSAAALAAFVLNPIAAHAAVEPIDWNGDGLSFGPGSDVYHPYASQQTFYDRANGLLWTNTSLTTSHPQYVDGLTWTQTTEFLSIFNASTNLTVWNNEGLHTWRIPTKDEFEKLKANTQGVIKPGSSLMNVLPFSSVANLVWTSTTTTKNITYGHVYNNLPAHWAFSTNSGTFQTQADVNPVNGTPLRLDVWAVTSVPEPETYAMLLAGLGVMGAVARRRKAQQA